MQSPVMRKVLPTIVLPAAALSLGFGGLGNNKAEVMQEMLLPDAVGVKTLQNTPWSALPGDPAPEAEAIVKRYLATLQSMGLNPNEQGVWLQSGPSLFVNHQGNQPLSAASLTKIATSLAALETWGPGHQFETRVYANGPIQNGVLQGNLVVEGTGDPMFVWEEAIALGNALNQAGISQITGELIIVGNFLMNFDFDPVKSGNFLKQAINSKAWQGGVSAQYAEMKPQPNKPTVVIQGNVRAVPTIDANQMGLTPVVNHKSLPLLQLVKRLNVYSNNVMSEVLSRLIGGPQITAERAARAASISQNEVLLINGSGLGVENRISPQASVQMFTALARYAERGGFTISDLFPVSGRDVGTLIDRSIPKNTVVKTGTLNEVCALAGVLPTRDRGLVWFSIINRGSQIEALRNQQDILLQQLQAAWGKPATLAKTVTPNPAIDASTAKLGAIERNEILGGTAAR